MTGLIRVCASDEPNSRWFCIGFLDMYSHMADIQDMSMVCHCRLCAQRRLPQVNATITQQRHSGSALPSMVVTALPRPLHWAQRPQSATGTHLMKWNDQNQLRQCASQSGNITTPSRTRTHILVSSRNLAGLAPAVGPC